MNVRNECFFLQIFSPQKFDLEVVPEFGLEWNITMCFCREHLFLLKNADINFIIMRAGHIYHQNLFITEKTPSMATLCVALTSFVLQVYSDYFLFTSFYSLILTISALSGTIYWLPYVHKAIF